MAQSYLSQYFTDVVLKTLTAVEASPATSNQHEYNGNRDLVGLFGRATSKHRFRARFVYVSDRQEDTVTDEAPVTWYDARQNHPTRSEHRLYFPTTRVSRRAAAGDLLVIGMLRDKSVLVVIAKEGSSMAVDLRRLFDVTLSGDEGFALWQKKGGLQEEEARSLLQAIGVLDGAAPPISPASGGAAERVALFVTSLPSDYAAVASQLRDISEQTDELGTFFQVGRYDSEVGVWEIAIVQLGLGTLYAAATVAQAEQRFLPEVVVLLGAAQGASQEMAIGDVVVASAIYTWEAGRSESRPTEKLASSYRILQRALKESVGNSWLSKRRVVNTDGETPKVAVAQIASSSPVEWNALRAPRIVAVDMEAAGLVDAFDRRAGVELLVIRGVASTDPLQKITNTRLASENATAFAFQVLSTLERASTADPLSAKAPTVQKEPEAYINRFRIQSIRSIQEIDWNLRTKTRTGWHVLVGANASGKTTALRCVALGLIGDRDTQALGQRWSTWVTHGKMSGDVVVTLSTGADEPFGEVRYTVSVDSGEIERSPSGQSPDDIFSVGYGPFRRFSGGDDEFKERLTPAALRHITLFSERADLADSLRWLQSVYVRELENDDKLCGQIQEFINNSNLLPSGVRLEEVLSDRIMFKDGNHCVVGIEDLSDGFRSVLSLVLDILRHLSDRPTDASIFSSNLASVVASGIVLIDEVDVHLHPKWQQEIGAWFKKHFPRFQFIVATHSLLVCQSADSVFILPDPSAAGSGRMLSEFDLNQIKFGNVLDGYGTGVFGPGVDESEDSKTYSQKLAALNLKQLREGLNPAEKAEQARLRALLPTSDILNDPVRGE